MCHFYGPQSKLRKGNVFTSVCQEFCPGGVPARHPPGQTRQTPPHGRQTPPSGQTRQTPPLAGRQPPSLTATAAYSTHPTGMHSCCIIFLSDYAQNYCKSENSCLFGILILMFYETWCTCYERNQHVNNWLYWFFALWGQIDIGMSKIEFV